MTTGPATYDEEISSFIPMKVNEVRAANNNDFVQFQQLASTEEGWQQRYNKHGTKVYTRLADECPIKIIKVVSELKETSIDAVFDTLNDPDYRKKWDDHMIESKDICKLDDRNDIGYYAVKLPKLLKNRDFLLQRSCLKTKTRFIIFSHSVQHKSVTLKKEFRRACCFVSGYIGEADDAYGCRVTYISQVDPRGRLPKWLVNRVSTRIAPKVVEKLRKAALNYAAWKNNNSPDWKPWSNLEQNNLPILDPQDLKIDSTEYLSEVIDESGIEEC